MNQRSTNNLNDGAALSTDHSTSATELERFRKSLGARIARVRTEAFKESQKGFASRMGVGLTTLQRYESGEREPDGSFLLHLADVGQLRLEWLLRGVAPMQEGMLEFDFSEGRVDSGDAPAATMSAGESASNQVQSEKTRPQPTPQKHYDRKLLMDVVAGLEDFFLAEGIDPPPERRAKLTALMYEICIVRGQIDREEMSSLLKVAA